MSDIKLSTTTLRLISSRAVPMKRQIVEVERAAEREAISYRFDVVRDDYGQITQIIMTPVTE